MGNDFDHIGFQVDSAEEFGSLITDNASRWARLPTPVGGAYVRAGDAHGAQLWIQLGPSGEPLGGHPHLSGTSRFNATVSRVLDGRAVNGTPLDGSLMVTLIDDQPGVPMLVDIPDFRMHAAWASPEVSVLLQLCAFPRHFQISADDAEFARSPLGKLSSGGALIPSGLFTPQGESTNPPRSEVILTGRVESCRSLTNPISNRSFHSLTVRTLGGMVDVPISPATMATPPARGAIMAGTFALSGRLIEPLPNAPAEVVERAQQEIAARRGDEPAAKSPAKRGLFGRLLGR